jgi:hypothetical protein
LRRSAGLLALLAFALALVFWPSPAQANVSCSASGGIAFGTSQTMTGTINYSCVNYGGATANFTLCSALGPASYPGTNAQPIMTSAASSQLKFNLYTTAGGTELTSVSSVQSFSLALLACTTGAEDPVEPDFATTSATSLRYGDGQFIQNWATPKGANRCYRVTMMAADGSTLSAFFKTK